MAINSKTYPRSTPTRKSPKHKVSTPGKRVLMSVLASTCSLEPPGNESCPTALGTDLQQSLEAFAPDHYPLSVPGVSQQLKRIAKEPI